ncbi:MAG TPA: hypothetical protein VFJ43_05585, partial [Bacteroidia bacterium]|nr:hypothetical protein [Bacteroidia bacterium]
VIVAKGLRGEQLPAALSTLVNRDKKLYPASKNNSKKTKDKKKDKKKKGSTSDMLDDKQKNLISSSC